MKAFKVVLFIAVLAAMIYLAVLFGMPQFRYRAFASDAREVVMLHVRNEEELKQNLLEKAEEYNLPVEKGQIVVSGEPGAYRARIAWSVTVNVHDLYEKKFDFLVDVGKGGR